MLNSAWSLWIFVFFKQKTAYEMRISDWSSDVCSSDLLIEKVGELAARGVGFRSLTEQIDTTTSGGMLVFNIFGSLAQFERDLIRERTHAGLRAARERGSQGGRRPVVTPDKLRKARAHIAAGLTVREAAARLKIGKTALYKALESA